MKDWGDTNAASHTFSGSPSSSHRRKKSTRCLYIYINEWKRREWKGREGKGTEWKGREGMGMEEKGREGNEDDSNGGREFMRRCGTAVIVDVSERAALLVKHETHPHRKVIVVPTRTDIYRPTPVSYIN
jgi:hypothetical protein